MRQVVVDSAYPPVRRDHYSRRPLDHHRHPAHGLFDASHLVSTRPVVRARNATAHGMFVYPNLHVSGVRTIHQLQDQLWFDLGIAETANVHQDEIINDDGIALNIAEAKAGELQVVELV